MPELPMFLHLFKDRRELQPLGAFTSASVSRREFEFTCEPFESTRLMGKDGEGTRDCHLPPLRVFISVFRRISKRACLFINTNSLRSVPNVTLSIKHSNKVPEGEEIR
ncbi:unnamed protein product [Leuciscus chuanchicus]